MIGSQHDSVIVRRLSRGLIPLVQIFALYILFFGQYGPGGGFVGGVMLGTSLILGILVFGPTDPLAVVTKRIAEADGVGLMIFAAVGGLCLIGGGQFLNYAELEIPGLAAPSRRYVGILLTQIGVAVDIAVTTVSIVFSLSVVSGNGDSHV